MRLIDLDSEYIQETLYRRGFKTRQDIEEWLNFAPTVDAVPVVRCKDCKHHYWEQEPCHGKSVHYCALPNMRGIELFKEFFCYYGERKDGDGNG